MKKLMIMFVTIMSTICTWGAGTPSGDLGRADLVLTPSDESAISYNNKYVDVTNGDDVNTGGYYDPWKTITNAQENATAGTQIIVAPGTYIDVASNASFLWYFMKGAVCDISFEPTVGNPLVVLGQGTLTYMNENFGISEDWITAGADISIQADILDLDFAVTGKNGGIWPTELDLVFQFEARKITCGVAQAISSSIDNDTYPQSARVSMRATESFIVPDDSLLGTYGYFAQSFGTIDAPYIHWGSVKGLAANAGGGNAGGVVITCERFHSQGSFSQYQNIIWDVGLFTCSGTVTISSGYMKGCLAQVGQVTITSTDGGWHDSITFDLTSSTGWNNQ